MSAATPAGRMLPPPPDVTDDIELPDTSDNADADADTSSDHLWWDDAEPEPLPPRRCRRTDSLVDPVAMQIELDGMHGVFCLPIPVSGDGSADMDGDTLVTLTPLSDDHDLCVWVDDLEWESDERYAECHRHRYARLPDLHCWSSRPGTEVDQARIEGDATGLMACTVPWQTDAGGHRMTFGVGAAAD